jgi:hypothetical protein
MGMFSGLLAKIQASQPGAGNPGAAIQAALAAKQGMAGPGAVSQGTVGPGTQSAKLGAGAAYSADPQEAFNQALANGLRGEDLIQTLQHQQGWTNGGAYYPDKDQYGFETFYAAPDSKGGFDLVQRQEHGPRSGGAAIGGMPQAPMVLPPGAGMSGGAVLRPEGDTGQSAFVKKLLAQGQNPDDVALRSVVGGQ